jgi:hypothetical protein
LLLQFAAGTISSLERFFFPRPVCSIPARAGRSARSTPGFFIPVLVTIFASIYLCAGVVLQLPDKKGQVFLVPIALTRWFPERARKVSGEMSERT